MDCSLAFPERIGEGRTANQVLNSRFIPKPYRSRDRG